MRTPFQVAVVGLMILVIQGCLVAKRRADGGVRPPLLISSHRGEHRRIQENSREAIEKAIKAGADIVEIDIRETADREFVLFHDRRILPDKVNAPAAILGLPVSEVKLEELRKVKFKNAKSGSVASLKEVLQMIKRHPKRMLELDIKSDTVDFSKRVFALVLAAEVDHQTIVHGEPGGQLETLRDAFPNAIIRLKASSSDELTQMIAMEPGVIQLPLEFLESESVNKIHDAGAKILVRTAETPEDSTAGWLRLYCLGVDIVMTDRTAELNEFRASLAPSSCSFEISQ